MSIACKDGTDMAAMQAFIESQFAQILKIGDVVVWDNLRPHHFRVLIEAIENTGDWG